jgi:hypothetical protein
LLRWRRQVDDDGVEGSTRQEQEGVGAMRRRSDVMWQRLGEVEVEDCGETGGAEAAARSAAGPARVRGPGSRGCEPHRRRAPPVYSWRADYRCMDQAHRAVKRSKGAKLSRCFVYALAVGLSG